MGDDHVRDAIGIDADKAQGIDGMTKPFAATADGGFIGEAGIENECAIGAAGYPDEIVEVGGEFVRVGGDEIFARMAIAEMAVANGEKFEWFDRHCRFLFELCFDAVRRRAEAWRFRLRQTSSGAKAPFSLAAFLSEPKLGPPKR